MDEITKKYIEEWTSFLERNQETVKELTEALDFQNTKITAKDLVNILEEIKNASNKEIAINELKENNSYSEKELDEIIIRLKKLGEIFAIRKGVLSYI